MTDSIATSNPEILGGTACFAGTRVPVTLLFENLADGLSLTEILAEYPTISRDMALRALSFGKDALVESAKSSPSDTKTQGRYMVSHRRNAKSHVWTGNDTACKMWSTGGLKTESYKLAKQPGFNGICSMCCAAEKN